MNFESLTRERSALGVEELTSIFEGRIPKFNKWFEINNHKLPPAKLNQYRNLFVILIDRITTLNDIYQFKLKEEEENPNIQRFCHTSLTDEEMSEVRRRTRLLLEEYPDSLVGEAFPDIVEELQLTKEYKDLLSQLHSGKIDKIDFNLKASVILDRINIDDLSK